MASLACQSRRPHNHPNQHTEAELKLIRDMRRRNPALGMIELWHRLRLRGYTRRPESLFRVMRKMGMFPPEKPKKDYKPKPYEQMTHPGERVQIDVKVVPRRCIADPELRLFQYTAIDELTRLRFLAAYPEQSTYSSADFLRKLRAWYARAGASIQQRCRRHADAVSGAWTCTVKSAKTCASQRTDPQTGAKRKDHPIIDRPSKEHAEAETGKSELVKARLLGNQCVILPQTRIVGCCHNLLHPGKLTKRLMTQHDCLGKNCRYFEKYEDAGYWKECDRKKEQKRTARQLQRMKREQEAATEAILQNLAELFQSYIDDAGYAMQIVRVDTERANRYRVFYVSEYPFADGDRFPKFLEAVRFFFPDYRLNLRHVRDVDGHFVTIEEYQQRARK